MTNQDLHITHNANPKRKIAILQAEILKIPIQDVAEAFGVDENTTWTERNRLKITRKTSVQELQNMIRKIEKEESFENPHFDKLLGDIREVESKISELRAERKELYQKIATIARK